MDNKNFNIIDALLSLAPNSEWVIRGEEKYENIEWMSKNIEKPSESNIQYEIKRLQDEYNLMQYQQLRAKEYPPMADYLDGIVKNDQDQIQAYIDACQAVKNKYPKPSV